MVRKKKSKKDKGPRQNFYTLAKLAGWSCGLELMAKVAGWGCGLDLWARVMGWSFRLESCADKARL